MSKTTRLPLLGLELKGSVHFNCIKQYATKADLRPFKKVHWAKLLKKRTSCDRALEHFDDFYNSVYKNRWPSMRLALLHPPKFFAVPNTFLGNTEPVAEKLKALGSFDVSEQWRAQQKLLQMSKIVDVDRDVRKIREMDKLLESVAATKQAEELDLLYKSENEELKIDMSDQEKDRVLSDIKEAAGSYVPTSKLKGLENFVLESEYYNEYFQDRDEQQPIRYTKKDQIVDLKFPMTLNPYTFEGGSAEVFPVAKNLGNAVGHREYLCVNGGSIAPILALDLRPGLSMLDICAGPGTKSLLSLMTFTLDHLVCNDLTHGRVRRCEKLFREFCGNAVPDNVTLLTSNGEGFSYSEKFDRVLADVPCLSDRASCNIADNNLFKTTRVQERLNLVQKQKNILISSFNALKDTPGSVCVYSTCTLSPIENDGAVVAALREVEREDLYVDKQSLWNVLAPLSEAGIYKLERTKCGVIIIPYLPSNCGPMFISRFTVIKNTEN